MSSTQPISQENELILPPELVGDAPRALPEWVSKSRLAQRRKDVFWACAFVGICCLLFEQLPFVKTLSLFIFSLAYLDWIGIAFLFLSAITFTTAPDFKKACKYITDGEAKFGKVLSLLKAPTLNVEGQTTLYAVFAEVELVHPESNEPTIYHIKSRDFSTDIKDRVSTRFRVGDSVPIVWMPNQIDKTIQIYDFLEISPTNTLLYDASTKMGLLKILGTIAAGVGFFSSLFWMIYTLGMYSPLNLGWQHVQWPIIIGVVLSLIIVPLGHRYFKKKAAAVDARNLIAVQQGEALEVRPQRSIWQRLFTIGLSIVGVIMFSTGFLLSILMTANALLDRSPRNPVPVEITKMVQITHNFIFREYKLEYKLPGDPKSHSRMSTPDQLSQFILNEGIAQKREGWLGWPWIETIDPVFGVPK